MCPYFYKEGKGMKKVDKISGVVYVGYRNNRMNWDKKDNPEKNGSEFKDILKEMCIKLNLK